MPSWQSYIVHPLLCVFVKRKLARSFTPREARAALGTHPPQKMRGVDVSSAELGGVRGEWTRAAEKEAGAMLYLHGGGYFACSPQTHRPITGGFARQGLGVFAPDYRLAPEHPFPAAVEDALAVYRALTAMHGPSRVVVAGDSAGGGLALSTMLAAREAGLAMPAGLVLFSPWTDLAGTGASIQANARRDSMLIGHRIQEVAALYLNGAPPETPLASPLYGDLAGLPPVLIQVSEREILLDDSVRLAEKIQSCGGRVELSIWRNLPHVWQISQSFLPEARQALAQAADFAKSALASAGAAS
ncbi:alpha/beta hydrolase [Acidocella sp.]|uniref:alpha/beta hydrolase n=1 Tax=Acidocella sp. TaxID=50710 RepID=UPI003D061C99